MSAPILVAYATRYGSTAEVAQFIASTLESRGISTLCQPAREVKSLQGIQAVVLGAPLFMFHWHKDALRFLDRFRADLQSIPTAAFALGPTTEPRSEKEWTDARAILAHTPRHVARDWSKLLESAVANAENNHELVGDELHIVTVKADEGPTLKRFQPRAMGRATKIRKRTSHLTITLGPKE